MIVQLWYSVIISCEVGDTEQLHKGRLPAKIAGKSYSLIWLCSSVQSGSRRHGFGSRRSLPFFSPVSFSSVYLRESLFALLSFVFINLQCEERWEPGVTVGGHFGPVQVSH